MTYSTLEQDLINWDQSGISGSPSSDDVSLLSKMTWVEAGLAGIL